MIYSHLTTNTNQQYSYLARSFLQGKLFFTEKPGTWEDTVFYNGKFYWHQGSFPALLLMPFVFLFQNVGLFFYQGYLQIFLTITIFYLSYKIARIYKYSYEDALFLAFSFCFASVYHIVAFVPWVWYFAQAITVFLCLFALYEYLTKKRYFLIGILFALILITRLNAALGNIFFLIAIFNEEGNRRIKNAILLFFPLVISLLVFFFYNSTRFGDAFNTGYTLTNNKTLSEKQRYELLQHGVFKVSNIPTNFYYYFIKTLDPVQIPVQTVFGNSHILQFPYITVRYPGTSFFIVAPFFLYIFRNKFKSKISQFAVIASIVILIPLLLYYWSGWRQVGPRYLLDLLPFIYLLLLEAFPKKKLSLKAKIVILLSSLFNFYLLSQVLPL